jgi:putative hemolysin
MKMSPTIEILIIFLLIFVNGLFVMSELAIVSARKVRLQQMAERGDGNARVALHLASSPNQFLGTAQIGITLLVILSGSFGEEVIARQIKPMLSLIPFLKPYVDPITYVLSIGIIAYLSLVIGELVPKRLALNHPEPIASVVAIPMQVLVTFGAPIVYVLSASTDFILHLLGVRPSTEPQVTEEEIKVLIEQGTEEGTFEEAEQDMVERIFRFGDRPVSGFMTPRPDIVWLDLEDPAEENRQKMVENGYSRYPVCQGGLDNVLGVIPVTDLLARSFRSESLDLTIGLRQPVFVPESTRGLKVLELFKQTITHMALVVDEYGVIQGVVTLNDVMSEIVGDVPSVDDQDNPQVVQREDGSWLLDGMLPVDEFFELFDIEIEDFPSHRRGSYQTLGGFVITHLGRIPAAADYFEWQHLRFEVVDMDVNRVDKVLVMLKQNITQDNSNSDSASHRH